MKKILILIMSLFLIALSGCKENVDEGKSEFYNDYSHYLKVVPKDWEWFDLDAYSNMLENNVFVKKSFQEIKEAMEGEKRVIIYLGLKPDSWPCPYCAISLPILNEAALEKNVKEILYLDIFQMRKDYENNLDNENSKNYKWLLDFITNQVADFGERIAAPDIYVIEDGKILSHYIATFLGEDGKYITDLTKEQKEELKKIYLDMLN